MFLFSHIDIGWLANSVMLTTCELSLVIVWMLTYHVSGSSMDNIVRLKYHTLTSYLRVFTKK